MIKSEIFYIFLDCPTGFQTSQKKYTAKEKALIAKALEHKDAKTCSKQCKESKFCVAFLIRQESGKSGSKTTGYECRLYYKDIKGLDKEVPICSEGFRIISLFLLTFYHIFTGVLKD